MPTGVRKKAPKQASADAKARALVTVAVPAYNEERNLPELFRRLTAVVDGIQDCDFELLLIDNSSADGTERLARERVAQDKRWRYIRFSRNFGIEASMSAALHYARGDALIFLFSDLQDPPEAIPTMIAKWREGYDIVYGEVRERHDTSILKTIGARIAYRLIHWLSDVKIPPNATDFRLMSRRVMEVVARCGERVRYTRGLVHWAGFRQCAFQYDRAPRIHGDTHAGLLFCLNYAISALVAFSVKPLTWASLVGILMTGLSVLGMVVYTILKILALYGMSPLTTPPSGWTTLIFLQFFFGGLMCFFLGILGHYLAHVYAEVKGRPLWALYATDGFAPEEDPLGAGRPGC